MGGPFGWTLGVASMWYISYGLPNDAGTNLEIIAVVELVAHGINTF